MRYIWLLIPYLIGSISFSYMAGKIFANIDIREHGSKNPGATNVYRTLGTKAFLFASFLDILKGFIAVFLTRVLFPNNDTMIILAALSVVIGHNWPVLFRFKGGKGIATTIGVLFGIHTISALIVMAIMAIIVYFTRYMSLASLVGTFLVPILLYFFGFDRYYIIFAIIITIMAWYRHRGNIFRLLNGTESTIGKKK